MTEQLNRLDELILAAKQASKHAYAPYSKFYVGAAALTLSGIIVSGCNVENASYGLTICAERNCLASAINQGEQAFSIVVIYTEQEVITPPCGACRQVLAEFLTSSSTVIGVNHFDQQKQWTIAELLPDAFTPKNLYE